MWFLIILLSCVLVYLMRIFDIRRIYKQYKKPITLWQSAELLLFLTNKYARGLIKHKIFWFYFDTLVISTINIEKGDEKREKC